MRKDTIYSGGKKVIEHVSSCHLDHVHHPDRYTTRGTGIPVISLMCTRTGTALTTVTGANLNGQLTLEFERVAEGVPLPTDAEKLETILALHVRDGDFCADDGFVWPCRTVRAANPSEATRGRLAGRLEGLVTLWRGRVVDTEARADDKTHPNPAEAERLSSVAEAVGICLSELEAAIADGS